MDPYQLNPGLCPPTLHIEILYFIDLLGIGRCTAYTLFVYLALSAAVAKYFNMEEPRGIEPRSTG
jgi:hypothetical protein